MCLFIAKLAVMIFYCKYFYLSKIFERESSSAYWTSHVWTSRNLQCKVRMR